MIGPGDVVATKHKASSKEDSPGIPEEQADKVLAPFVKLNPSRGHRNGYGLGVIAKTLRVTERRYSLYLRRERLPTLISRNKRCFVLSYNVTLFQFHEQTTHRNAFSQVLHQENTQ